MYMVDKRLSTVLNGHKRAQPDTTGAQVLLDVVTAAGAARYQVPAGRVATVCGLEIDSDLLSGGGARLVTCPDALARSDARGWVCAAPEWRKSTKGESNGNI